MGIYDKSQAGRDVRGPNEREVDVRAERVNEYRVIDEIA